MKKCGIYQIINIVNGKRYVGSAVDIEKRFKDHLFLLNKNNHHSRYFQNAWNKYGNSAFVFVVLEETRKEKEVLLEKEQYWLDFYRSYDGKYGYNISPTAGTCLGIKKSEESNRKNRERQIGEKSHSAKLMWVQVNEIRERYKKENITYLQLSKEYGVAKGTIQNVVKGSKWKQKDYKHESKCKIILNWSLVKEIRELYKNGEYSQKKIAELYGMSEVGIQQVLENLTWFDENYIYIPRKWDRRAVSTLIKVTDEQKNHMKEDEKIGLSYKQISEKYKICLSMVYKILRKYKYKRNKSGNITI